MNLLKLLMLTAWVFTFGNIRAQAVSILYFNDAHEIMPVSFQNHTKGGVARLKTLVDEVKKHHPTLTIFGGDLAGGTLFGKMYKGFPMVEAFNKIPIDIANFGQHEFDFGVKNAHSLMDKSQFDWITSNITHRNGQPIFNLPKYKVLNINGIKIGFIGLTDKVNTSLPGEDLAEKDYLIAAKEAITLLNMENPDYIIAVTQMPLKDNLKLLEAFPIIKLALTEDTSEQITRVEHIRNQYIISPIGNMGSVVEVQVQKEKDGNISSAIKIHYLDESIPQNPELEKIANNYQHQMEQTLAKNITVLPYDLDRGSHLQTESVIGNLITDAYQSYFKTDFAMMNAGGIRAEQLKKTVTLKEIYSILPFDNQVGVVELSGEEIKELIQTGLKNYTNLGGEFVQVSGLSYRLIKPSDSKSATLEEVWVNGKPIDSQKKYSIAMPSYIIQGGGEYTSVSPEKISNRQMIPYAEPLIWYLKKHRDLHPKLEGRISVK